MKIKSIFLAIASLSTVMFINSGAAGGIDLVDASNDCDDINCQSQTINGSIQAHPGKLQQNANWTYTTYCSAGRCCRFHVTANQTGEKLSMVVITAGSIVYRTTGVTPTLEIEPTRSGPAEVIITHYLETHDFAKPFAPHRFKLVHGQYDYADNPNCANPATQLISQQ